MQGKMYDIRQDLIKLETAVPTYKRLNGMQDFEDEVIANALLFNTAPRGVFRDRRNRKEPRHEEIVNEILVVSSKKRAEEIFRRMKSYLFEYMDAQAVDEILRVYFELVNASNSYIRIKPGLPSDDED